MECTDDEDDWRGAGFGGTEYGGSCGCVDGAGAAGGDGGGGGGKNWSAGVGELSFNGGDERGEERGVEEREDFEGFRRGSGCVVYCGGCRCAMSDGKVGGDERCDEGEELGLCG